MHRQATIISGVRKKEVPHDTPAQEQDGTSQERYVDCFCARSMVLLNTMDELLAYILNERLTELVEHEGILEQAQGGFRQDKSTDINA